MTLGEYAGRRLAQLADSDPRVFVLDGDLADSDGASHFAQKHPDRFLMAGIAEQNMVSVAAGMAAAGMKPFVFSFGAFLSFRAYDQIRVCLSQARQPVVLMASHATGLAGRNGKTHASLNDLALMLSLPHIEIWTPVDSYDIDLALDASLRTANPVYIRMPRAPFPASERLQSRLEIVRWALPKQPNVILSHGLATRWALEAARILQQRGMSVGILHFARLKPLPSIGRLLSGVIRGFVVEDHVEGCALSTIINALQLPMQTISLGWPAIFDGKSGHDTKLRDHFNLSGEKLAEIIAAHLNQPQQC